LSQALTAPPSVSGLADTGVPGLQLALASAASVYFLRENKRLGLGQRVSFHKRCSAFLLIRCTAAAAAALLWRRRGAFGHRPGAQRCWRAAALCPG